MKKKIKKQIIQNLISLLKTNRDQKEVNSFVHVDNLRDEVEEQNFNYSLEELNFVLSEIFYKTENTIKSFTINEETFKNFKE